MMRTSHCAVIAAALGLVLSASATRAQYDDQPPPEPITVKLMRLPEIELKGTVDKVQPELIGFKCEGNPYVMRVDATLSRVQCTGTADQGYLKPGVMVRFETELDKKWQAKAPLEELTVVTPSDTAMPGIHTDAPAGDGQGRGKRQTNDLYVVVGTIKAYKDNQLIISADGKTVKADVMKDAKVGVEVDDYTLAAAGDEITAKVRQMQPPAGQVPGQVFAEVVTITLSKPLSSNSKVSTKAKKPAKATKRAAR